MKALQRAYLEGNVLINFNNKNIIVNRLTLLYDIEPQKNYTFSCKGSRLANYAPVGVVLDLFGTDNEIVRIDCKEEEMNDAVMQKRKNDFYDSLKNSIVAHNESKWEEIDKMKEKIYTAREIRLFL